MKRICLRLGLFLLIISLTGCQLRVKQTGSDTYQVVGITTKAAIEREKKQKALTKVNEQLDKVNKLLDSLTERKGSLIALHNLLVRSPENELFSRSDKERKLAVLDDDLGKTIVKIKVVEEKKRKLVEEQRELKTK